jgi:hypothetical protein
MPTPGEHQAFCTRMREHRERAGVSLSAIASATKINASFFAAFERNDLSRWPHGIYRRAFFRDYVTAIGHPSGPAVREFVRLFCAEERAEKESSPADPAGPPVDPLTLRLTLATAHTSTRVVFLQRITATAIEALALLTVAGLLALAVPVSFAIAAAVAAFGYYPLTIVCLGQSGAGWWLERRSRTHSSHTPGTADRAHGETAVTRTRATGGPRSRQWRGSGRAQNRHGRRGADLRV